MKNINRKMVLILMVFAVSLIPAFSSAEEVTTEVLLVIKSDEILAFSARQNKWVSANYKLRERVIDKSSAGNVAIVFTNLRVLGYSAFFDYWEELGLKMNEHLLEIQSDGNVATVVTDKRVFAFNARTGKWLEAK